MPFFDRKSAGRRVEGFPQHQGQRERHERSAHGKSTRKGFVIAPAKSEHERAAERHKRQDGN
jgi:hypothetical protein